MFLFPGFTQLDLTGPYEVFARLPNTHVHLLAETREPVASDRGLAIVPDTTYEQAPRLDILCVPGGPGTDQMMEHQPLLAFLRQRAPQARFITSVCTGALVLGAAGLLDGYRATTHWMALDLLPLFGATPVEERVVIDRNRITGGGITAGIDFGLTVAATLFGTETAQNIQLLLEYNPEPPFASGSPATAPADLVERMRSRRNPQRRAVAERAAARLHTANSNETRN